MSDTNITPEQIAERGQHLLEVEAPRYQRLWSYFRNTMRYTGDDAESAADRPYRQAQEWGLPQRIIGEASGRIARKEVVIENDIGWRVETMMQFLSVYGKASKAMKQQRKRRKRRPKPYRLKPLRGASGVTKLRPNYTATRLVQQTNRSYDSAAISGELGIGWLDQ